MPSQAKQSSPYTTDNTCRECRKYDGGCWIVSNSGCNYMKHKPHHACNQFVPMDVWGYKFDRDGQTKKQSKPRKVRK